MRLSPLGIFLLATVATTAAAKGIRLEGWEYPFPTRAYPLESQHQELEMVYMDIGPRDEGTEVALLLHGKNFSGSYFGETAEALASLGYRVIMPDQIGFGKSSKPESYHYSFHQLARNTWSLLDFLDVDRVHVLGHSMGGMLAVRFALQRPEATASLTLLNPIGLEDWDAKGVPYRPVEDWYEQELAQSAYSLRAYQQEFYYDGEWSEAYEPWLQQLCRFLESADYPRMAWNQALTYDMIFTQPVLYDFDRIQAPTLLIIGQRDRTALGRDRAPEELRAELGDYPSLGRAAHASIPQSELAELSEVGHLPHIESFERFFAIYRRFLGQQSSPAEP